MGEKLKKLRDVLNALTGYDPRRNADGTMTTKHGNRIILPGIRRAVSRTACVQSLGLWPRKGVCHDRDCSPKTCR